MSAAVLTPEPVADAAPPGDGDGLTHTVCWCDVDEALCGADVAGLPALDEWDDEDLCVVCEDLDRLPCARCGA